METSTVTKLEEAKFDLDMPVKGRVRDSVIAELARLRNVAKDESETFTEAVKEIAKKHALKPGALKRYVCAVADDKVQALAHETADVEKLLAP